MKVFPDGTRFEIYGESFSCCSGLDRAGGIEDYVKSAGGEVTAVYKEPLGPRHGPFIIGPDVVPYGVGLPEPPPRFPLRSLSAWRTAGALIDWARRRG